MNSVEDRPGIEITFKSSTGGSSSRACSTTCECNCPTQPNFDSNNNACPICLLKFNTEQRLPRGYNTTHNIICQKCISHLHPHHFSLINSPLLILLGFPVEEIPGNEKDHGKKISPACGLAIENLNQLAFLAKSGSASRAILKKISSLFLWLTPHTQLKLIKHGKSLGNRILLELISQNQGSHYRAQQQLWAAIRSKACQFMGPALQDEAIKLILLALEDGSALSKKILIMFVVQRLNPQFPQASKTSIGHVIQLLYRSSCFHFIKQPATGTSTGAGNGSVISTETGAEDTKEGAGGASSSNLMTLKQEFRSYEAIRREHDTQIIKIALESGLHFAPDQWSQILYGDNTHKSQMQSILDKLVEPQSFKQLTTEYLITIQRLQDEAQSKLLLDIHPCFEKLAAIDVNTAETTWENVADVTGLLYQTLSVLIQQKKSVLEKSRRRPSRSTSLSVSAT